jgi:hypothetical protein
MSKRARWSVARALAGRIWCFRTRRRLPVCTSSGIVRRRKPPALVVVAVVLPQACRLLPRPPPSGARPRSARASSRVLMPAPTRICRVCAGSSGSIASSPTHTNSRPGSFMHSRITWSSAFLTWERSATEHESYGFGPFAPTSLGVAERSCSKASQPWGGDFTRLCQGLPLATHL